MIRRNEARAQEDLQVVPNQCSRDCSSQKCLEIADQKVNQEDCKVLQGFKKSSSTETKNNLLNHLRAQKVIVGNEGEIEGLFAFGGEFFCVRAFEKLTGVSQYLLKQVLTYHSRGFDDPFVYGSKETTKLHVKTITFISWFQEFARIFGQFERAR